MQGIKREGLVVPSPTMLSPDHIMNAYKLQTPQVYQSSYFISTLLQANSFAKCREPLGFLTPVSFPVQSDSVSDLSIGVKILKYIVEWAKCIPLFTDLSKSDQEKILESSWLELFVLVATQYRLFPLWSKWAMYSCQGDSEEQNKMLRYIESVVEKYRLMDCDYVEIECLKAIVLYNADCSGLTNNSTVEQLKEGTLASLDDYIRSRYPNRTSRFGCLLLHLPGLRYLKSQVTEDFIFPELSKNPEFISRFIKDTLSLSLPTRIPPHFVNYGMLPR